MKPEVLVWITESDGTSLAMEGTLADSLASTIGPCVWVQGKFLERTGLWTWGGKILRPRASFLARLIVERVAAIGATTVMEVPDVGELSLSTLLSGQQRVSFVVDGRDRYFVHVPHEPLVLRECLDLYLGLGRSWALLVIDLPWEAFSRLEPERFMERAREGTVAVLVEDDGEVMSVAVRSDDAAARLATIFREAAEGLGCKVEEGP